MPQDVWKPSSFEPIWQPSSFESDKKDATSPSVDSDTSNTIVPKTKSTLDKVKDVASRLWYSRPEMELSSTAPQEMKDRVAKLKAEGKDDSILPPNITGKHEPESYWGGFANSVYKDFVRPAVTPDSLLQGAVLGGFGKSSRGLTGLRAEGDATLAAANKGLPIDPSPILLPENFARPQTVKNAPLGLPPASGPEISAVPSKPTFYSGPAGVTDASKTYPLDIAPRTPDFSSINQRALDDAGNVVSSPSGTVLPREVEGITNLPAIDAARMGTRLGDISKIETSSPKANLVSLDKIRQGAPVQLPQVGEDLGNIGRLDSEYQFGSNGEITKSPYELESAPKQSKFKPQSFVADGAETGSSEGQSLGESQGTSKVSKENNPSGVPAPGKPISEPTMEQPNSNVVPKKDINFAQQELSVDRTLKSRPETAPVADAIIGAYDKKQAWIGSTERALAPFVSGLGKADRRALGDLLNRPITAQDPPDLVQRANGIRKILNDIWTQIPGTQSNPNVGFIDNYLTHIEKVGGDIGDGIRGVWENNFGKPFKKLFTSPELVDTKGSGQNIFTNNLGSPNSPFAQTRTGGLKNIDLDVKKVLPSYVESIAKLIHDAPAVEQAKQVIAKLPDTDVYGQKSRIKALAEWYVQNYTRYDAQAALGRTWNQVTNALLKTTSRSMLGFSTGLQTLHLARIPANLFPELGGEYLAKGVGEILKNPAAAYRETASLGLLQDEVRPFEFKTFGQRVDSLISLPWAADFLDRSIGYNGFKQKFLDAGMSMEDATAKALAESKRASLMVDPARPIKLMNPEPGAMGMINKLTTQFKQVPVKIIEQYVDIAMNAKKDPAMAARAVAGMGLTVGLAAEGLHTFHISPKQAALDTGGATWSAMRDIYRNVAKGNLVKALEDTALYLTPAGKSIKRQVNKGLTAFDQENRDIPMPR